MSNHKYKCEKCTYSTDKSSNYKRHLISKKHITNDIDTDNISDNLSDNISDNLSDNQLCVYCETVINHKKNILRHYNICKVKNKLVEFEKEKHKLLQEKITVIQEKENEIDNIKKQFNDFIKTVAEKFIAQPEQIQNNNIIINPNITNKCINYFYIKDNFTDAHNYEDLMRPPLTMDEKKSISDTDATTGCAKLLRLRCIDNIDIDKRPFHSLDIARNKFALKSNDKWSIDQNGEAILRGVFPKIKEIYKTDDPEDYQQNMINISQLIEMQDKGKKKIVDELSRTTFIKNTS